MTVSLNTETYFQYAAQLRRIFESIGDAKMRKEIPGRMRGAAGADFDRCGVGPKACQPGWSCQEGLPKDSQRVAVGPHPGRH